MVQANLSVDVTRESSPSISVQVTNSGGREDKLYVGLTVTRPDGTRVNLKPKQVVLQQGEQGTVTFSAGEGCLSPRTGGPETPVTVFNTTGLYDVTARVFGEQNARSPETCFGGSLSQPLTSPVTVENAVKVGEQDTGLEIGQVEGVLAASVLVAGGVVLLDQRDMMGTR